VHNNTNVNTTEYKQYYISLQVTLMRQIEHHNDNNGTILLNYNNKHTQKYVIKQQ